MNSDKVLEEYKQDVVYATKGLKKENETYIAGAIIIKYNKKISIFIAGVDKNYNYLNPNYFLHNKILDMYKDEYDVADINGIANDFKEDSLKGYTFPKLLKEIEKINGIEIIRFMSPHPKDFSDELIETIKNSKKIARQIHLPLQSGSSKILKEMNRKYTKEKYLEIVEKLKKADKNISFSTDIIVGFPNETEQDFKETLDVVKKVGFDQVYMFIYSKRVGTRAANMTDETKPEEKVSRLERLKALYEEMLPELNKKMIGKSYKVLVEGKSKNNDKLFTGRTSQNKVVVFEATKQDIGKIKNVEIESEHLWYLKGKIVDK